MPKGPYKSVWSDIPHPEHPFHPGHRGSDIEVAQRLQAASIGLERHFPELAPGGGVALLRHSYALIVGLWQMTASRQDLVPGTCHIDALDYPTELQRALGALWDGTIGRRLAQSSGTAAWRITQ